MPLGSGRRVATSGGLEETDPVYCQEGGSSQFAFELVTRVVKLC